MKRKLLILSLIACILFPTVIYSGLRFGIISAIKEKAEELKEKLDQPPTVSTTIPLEGKTVSGIFTITAEVTDDKGINKVEFYINGVLKFTDTTPPYSYSLDTTLESEGSLIVKIIVYDTANQTTSGQWTVIVDNIDDPPTVSITNPAAGSAVSGTVTVTADAWDDRGLKKVIFYINGVSKSTDTISPYSYSWDTTLESTGTYVIKAIAYDTTNQTATDQRTVTVFTAWAQAAGGHWHTIATKSDGTLWAWGRNRYGQLGLGDFGPGTDKNTPVQVGTDTWTSVSGGREHTLAIKTDGTLWAWGSNFYGQLGLGDSGFGTDRDTPTQVSTDTWASVSGGWAHTLAIKTDGTLWAWGWNDKGQLGLGDSGPGTNRNTPTQVSTDTWTSVSGGDFHTIAIKADGTLWAWGGNSKGQLGLGGAADRDTPIQVSTDTWTSVATGASHTIAIRTLWAWGDNNRGQLGLGHTTDKHTPTQIAIAPDDPNTIFVASGAGHVFASTDGGASWSWGDNSYGQLGLGHTTDKHTPTQIAIAPDGPNTIFVACGGWHTIYRSSNGTLRTCGNNDYGQLGLGDSGPGTERNTLTKVGQ